MSSPRDSEERAQGLARFQQGAACRQREPFQAPIHCRAGKKSIRIPVQNGLKSPCVFEAQSEPGAFRTT
ncbi:hypothetical protein NDU88_003039 [Pleurodeles waltl]|uniref:Uncharacterized protein n=1 Tax=Pleurodeles waltl TaxID=8319 RepID=A0AAV7MT53_PLEWA|nr:hypothetical protein NDU88_003039 [Pleurodeles waltl]